jgi:CheY-like chemotaxis protein
MLAGKRIFVVEEQFLVALDIQRMLEESGAGPMVFARSVAEALATPDIWPQFHLAVIEAPLDGAEGPELAARLRDIGVPVVMTSADISRAMRFPALDGVPLVLKPFDADSLLSACRSALALGQPG